MSEPKIPQAPEKTNMQLSRERIEKAVIKPETKEKIKANQVDLIRRFVKVFNSPEGQIVLDHLDKYSHTNFPNYDNAYATYSKIGEQTLVDYIKNILNTAKRGDV